MIELLWVLGALLIMAAVSMVPSNGLILAGVALAGVGLVGGSAAGLVYHLRLRVALNLKGKLARDWWLRPVRQHQHLNDQEKLTLQPWFSLGALGMVVSIAGCVLAMGGVIKFAVFPD